MGSGTRRVGGKRIAHNFWSGLTIQSGRKSETKKRREGQGKREKRKTEKQQTDSAVTCHYCPSENEWD